MRPVDPSIEPLLVGLASDHRFPTDAVDTVRQAINESPYLTNLLANAATNGHVEHIAFSQDEHSGGHYDPDTNTIHISATSFERESRDARVDRIVAVLGHEGMHAALKDHSSRALAEFKGSYATALQDAWEDREHYVDLTEPARKYLEYGKTNETLSEISGMRAVDSRLRHRNPGLSDDEISQELAKALQTDCTVDTPTGVRFANGVHYEDIKNIRSPNATGLTEAIGQCYYSSPGRLGRHGDSDYQNYYGAYVISSIGIAGAHLDQQRGIPEVRLNMASLGLNPRQLERNGLDFGGAKTINITDIGPGGHGIVQLHHTAAETRKGHPPTTPVRAQQYPSSAVESTVSDQLLQNVAEAQGAPKAPLLADSPMHPDHGTYERIYTWIRDAGNWDEPESRNVAAALYKQQANDPLLKRVDNVTGALGKDGAHNVFAIYAPYGMDKGPLFHTVVDGRQAAQEQAQQNLQQAEDAKRSQNSQQALDQTQQKPALQEHQAPHAR